MTCITRRATSKIARTSNQESRVQARGKEKTQRDEGLDISYCSHVCPRVRCGVQTGRQGSNETMLIMFPLPCAIHTPRLFQLQPRAPHTATDREDLILSKAKSLIQKPMDKKTGLGKEAVTSFHHPKKSAQPPGCQ